MPRSFLRNVRCANPSATTPPCLSTRHISCSPARAFGHACIEFTSLRAVPHAAGPVTEASGWKGEECHATALRGARFDLRAVTNGEMCLVSGWLST